MREILTIIAACLVAALTAALAIPPFIDWDARRDEIAAQISERIGGPVEIGGPVALRLLPAPRLTVGSLSAGRSGLTVRSHAAAFELSPTSLLRGRLEFTEIALDKPTIAVDPNAFVLSPQDSARVGVERLIVTDGAIEVAGEKPVSVTHVDLTGAMDALLGPFRGSGVWRSTTFQFATAAVEDGRLRGKIALDEPPAGLHAEFDGDARFEGGALYFVGRGASSGMGGGRTPPWRTTFDIAATPDALRFDNLEARVGDDDHALSFSGAARYAAGAPLDIKLKAANLDLDRFRASHDFATVSGWASSRALDLRVEADSATLGGETLSQPAVALRLSPGAPAQALIDAGLPGATRLHFDGAIDQTDWRSFDGAARIETRDVRRLADYVAPIAPEAIRRLAAASFNRLAFDGRIKTAPDRFEAQARSLDLDRSRLSGRFAWRAAEADSRSRISAAIEASALDIDGLPDLRALGGIGRDDDLDLSVDAKAVRIAEVGQSSAAAGRIRAHLLRKDGVTTLEELSIADLGGATLTGVGRLTAQGGGLDLKLDAQRLGDLAALIRRVAPGAASDALVARASALSPAKATMGVATNAAGAFTQLNLESEAGGARYSAQLQPTGDGRVKAQLVANAPDASVLLRQFGFPVLPLRGLGAARVEAVGEGAWGGALSTRARVELPGASMTFNGETTASADRPAMRGRIMLDSADAAPLMQLFGLGAPDPTQRAPAKATATVAMDREGLSLDGLTSEAFGAKATGGLRRGADAIWRGELAIDRLSAPFLASFVLGPAQPALAGALWSTLKFAPQRVDPPAADLKLAIGRFDLGVSTSAGAHLELTLGQGLVEARKIDMPLLGGRLTGEASLRREGGAATARARLAVRSLDSTAGPFAAKVDGACEISGAGGSAAELVASLAGSGNARLQDWSIARAAPDTFSDAVARLAMDDATTAREAVVSELASALDSGAQCPAPVDVDFTLAAGRLTIAPVEFEAARARGRMSGVFDLRTGQVEVRENLRAPAPADWSGAPPQIDLSWSGPWSQPARALSAEALIAALTERAIERESERNAALEADIRERAFFNRRLKSDRRLDAERRAQQEEEQKALDEARKLLRPLEPISPDKQAPPPPPKRPPAAFAPAPRGATPDPSTAGRY